MSRTGATTVSAAIALAFAGTLSGLLIDESGGLTGAFEWLLRTIVVVAAAVAIGGGVMLAARVRRRIRPRPLGWVAAGLATVAFAWVVALPVAYGVYLTHLPARRAVHDADLGAPKERVALPGADGVTLHGWYVPSRNDAAVIALHGTGSNRVGVAGQARVLVAHGYGVLALDLRGHGESGGRSMSVPWKLDRDLDAAVDWLKARADVDADRIGALGVSLGAEVAIRLAARRPDLRATVAEGLQGSAPADYRAAGQDVASDVQTTALLHVNALLAGGGAPDSDGAVVERIAPRPLLLISSGTAAEARAAREFARRAGAELWNLPHAAHGAALTADPGGYDRRVAGFLNRALRG